MQSLLAHPYHYRRFDASFIMSNCCVVKLHKGFVVEEFMLIFTRVLRSQLGRRYSWISLLGQSCTLRRKNEKKKPCTKMSRPRENRPLDRPTPFALQVAYNRQPAVNAFENRRDSHAIGQVIRLATLDANEYSSRYSHSNVSQLTLSTPLQQMSKASRRVASHRA